MTVNVALKDDGYGVAVSHPTKEGIIDIVNDRISYEKLQVDILPDGQKTLFDVDLFYISKMKQR